MKVLVPVKRVIDANIKVRVKSDQSGVELSLAVFQTSALGGSGGSRAQCGMESQSGEAGYTGEVGCCMTGDTCNAGEDGGLECEN